MRINSSLQEHAVDGVIIAAKIVDKITFKSDQEMLKVCRCWKSGTFPLCDGTHAEHCKSGADNAGPALIFHEKK